MVTDWSWRMRGTDARSFDSHRSYFHVARMNTDFLFKDPRRRNIRPFHCASSRQGALLTTKPIPHLTGECDVCNVIDLRCVHYFNFLFMHMHKGRFYLTGQLIKSCIHIFTHNLVTCELLTCSSDSERVVVTPIIHRMSPFNRVWRRRTDVWPLWLFAVICDWKSTNLIIWSTFLEHNYDYINDFVGKINEML